MLLPCLFNFYAEYVMWSTKLDEAHTRIKIVGKNTDNLRYAEQTTLMSEREEELKSLLISMKTESEKNGLKLNIQNSKIMSTTSWWQIDGETIETATDFIFWGSQNHCRWWLQLCN